MLYKNNPPPKYYELFSENSVILTLIIFPIYIDTAPFPYNDLLSNILLFSNTMPYTPRARIAGPSK